jgi:hypothetical protein
VSIIVQTFSQDKYQKSVSYINFLCCVIRNLDNVGNKLGFGDSFLFKMSLRVLTPLLKSTETLKDKSAHTLSSLCVNETNVSQRGVYNIMALVI